MRYIISIALPIILIALAFTSMYHYQKNMFKNFIQETAKSYALSTVIIALAKTLVALVLLVFVHNSFHDNHYLELILYLVVFLLFSVIQSAHSWGGFLTRNKLFYYQTRSLVINESRRFSQLFNWFNEHYQEHSKTAIKVGVVIVFILVFLPNFSVLITTNILFIVLITALIIVSLVFNQLIYFGLIVLLLFQLQPETLTFESFDLLLMSLAFIVLFVGLSIDHRLQQKMFFLITMMPVKRFNFKLGYQKVSHTNQVTIYQNIINHYYYLYYHKMGLVVVYHSDVDVKMSKIVQLKMMRYGKKYILRTSELA